MAARSTPRDTPHAKYALGVDVGTGSARAGVFDLDGKLLASAVHPVTMFRPEGEPDFYQQSSNDIWNAVCTATKNAVQEAGVARDEIMGVGFDATCSLVALDSSDMPMSVDPTGEPEQNVIVWLDHRANNQAQSINSDGHSALRNVGGVISPEMEIPKLSWLKQNQPDEWWATMQQGKFLDLADFLVYRATGAPTRSLCTTVCKWNYDAAPAGAGKGWDQTFLDQVGVGDLTPSQIGLAVEPMGEAVGDGLTEAAASDLGLAPNTPVGVGIIDAHAGGLGVLGAKLEGQEVVDAAALETRLALIAGTSCCHMASSVKPVFVPGVWGPYYSAMVPELYLNEGGQSTAGKLLDHITLTHGATPELEAVAKERGVSRYTVLDERLAEMAQEAGLPARKLGLLTADLHVTPDFFGNRSPLADPSMRGGISGLPLSASLDDLALLYLATLQALAYQTKHIIDTMTENGHAPIETIWVTGGLIKNRLYLQAHADATGCTLVLPQEQEAVLLGSAVLGARAAGAFPDLPSAMSQMSSVGELIEPYQLECADECDVSVPSFHAAKYRVFRKMTDDQREYRGIMEEAVLD